MQKADHRPTWALARPDVLASLLQLFVFFANSRALNLAQRLPLRSGTGFFHPIKVFISCSVGLGLMLGLVTTSHAQQTSIGFVDIPYLIDKAPQAADAELRLETEFAPRQLQLEDQRERLEEIRLRLKAEALELSDVDRGNLERDARGLERRLKRDELDFREELNIQKNNEFRKVRILVLEAIARFGKANNYDLIVSDGVLYANKSIDVTEKILEQLVKSNRALQSSN